MVLQPILLKALSTHKLFDSHCCCIRVMCTQAAAKVKHEPDDKQQQDEQQQQQQQEEEQQDGEQQQQLQVPPYSCPGCCRKLAEESRMDLLHLHAVLLAGMRPAKPRAAAEIFAAEFARKVGHAHGLSSECVP
jgi:hemolysin activation/secretion protein